jgi:hypothetical protein
VWLATLKPHEVIARRRQPVDRRHDPVAVWVAYVSCDAQRGGGVDTSLKGDTHGLGVTKRPKKRCEAQPMVTQRTPCAHNTIGWARQWLTPDVPSVRAWGLMRMVREVVHVSGQIVFDHRQRSSPLLLHPADPLAKGFAPGVFA